MSRTDLRRSWQGEMAADFDVLIVGGGMVGAALACALIGLPLKVALVEAIPFPALSKPGYDDRCSALSYATVRVLQTLGVWDKIAADATPIRSIHVSERGGFGVTRLNAADAGVEAYGQVVPNRVTGSALLAQLQAATNITVINPARVTHLLPGGEHLTVMLEEGGAETSFQVKLLVAADGTESPIRNYLGIEATRRDYGHSAIIANVTPSRPHNGVAYERFTPAGPVAMLPLPDRCAMVFTVPNDQADYYRNLPDHDFLQIIQARFGGRLGRFKQIGRRQMFPIGLVEAQRMTDRRVVLMGNAAHTMHPVAGQGFNLALREVALLAEMIAQTDDPGETALLESFVQRSAGHRQLIGRGTDGLSRLFTTSAPGLVTARSLGLIGLDLWEWGKVGFTREAMGIDSTMPLLARGRRLNQPIVRIP